MVFVRGRVRGLLCSEPTLLWFLQGKVEFHVLFSLQKVSLQYSPVINGVIFYSYKLSISDSKLKKRPKNLPCWTACTSRRRSAPTRTTARISTGLSSAHSSPSTWSRAGGRSCCRRVCACAPAPACGACACVCVVSCPLGPSRVSVWKKCFLKN